MLCIEQPWDEVQLWTINDPPDRVDRTDVAAQRFMPRTNGDFLKQPRMGRNTPCVQCTSKENRPMKGRKSLSALLSLLVALASLIIFSGTGNAEEPDDPKNVPAITEQLPGGK